MKVLMCGDLGHGCRDYERFAIFDYESIRPQIVDQNSMDKVGH